MLGAWGGSLCHHRKMEERRVNLFTVRECVVVLANSSESESVWFQVDGALLKMGNYRCTTMCQYWDNRLIY